MKIYRKNILIQITYTRGERGNHFNHTKTYFVFILQHFSSIVYIFIMFLPFENLVKMPNFAEFLYKHLLDEQFCGNNSSQQGLKK